MTTTIYFISFEIVNIHIISVAACIKTHVKESNALKGH